jgi:hypothetical protein
MKAKESHKAGRKNENRIVYPLSTGDGWAIYTVQTTRVKKTKP